MNKDFSKISTEQLKRSIINYKNGIVPCIYIDCYDECPFLSDGYYCKPDKEIHKAFKKELKRRKSELQDKDLAWFWDDEDATFRTLRFYDAKNKRFFLTDGTRNGFKYAHYKKANIKKLPKHIRQWAEEARGKLDD